MNAAANSESYSDPVPFVVKGFKGLTVKPKIRPMADGSMIVTFVCGATATITRVEKDHGKVVYLVDGEYRFGAREEFSDVEHALRTAALRCKLVLAPLAGRSSEDWLALAKSCDDIDVCCKELRKLLRESTGRDWSVHRGRGTAYSWLTITSPPKRRALERHGRSSYMSVEDQILLSAALGSHVHVQGESIRPGGGVRGAYVFRIAGVGVPENWRIESKDWD